jgi:hypothetical protein
MIVEVKIKKGPYTGFGKIEETISDGFSASNVDGKGSVFSFVDHKVKFLWMNMPKEEEFSVKYKVKLADESAVAKACEIRGIFSYIENEMTMKATITNEAPSAVVQKNKGKVQALAKAETKFNVPTTAAPAETANKPATPKNSPPSKPVTVVKPKPEIKKDIKQAVKNVAPVKSTSSNAGVFFRVQIGAFHKKVTNHSYDDVPELDLIVREDGIFDYVSGKFAVYEDAVKRRNQLKGSFKDCFVIGFKDGKRVSLESVGISTK